MSAWGEPLTPAERADVDRYEAALHAVQSGIKFELQLGSDDGSPKHLRVGINAAFVSDAAIVWLLVEKGIVTRSEWFAALADAAHVERVAYEQRLTELLGTHVSLE